MKKINKYATVVWHGTGKEGSGRITSESKSIENSFYTWNTRFGDEKGTNPEELIAAAHAGCFTMKLAFLLSDEGYIPESLETKSTVTLEGSDINHSHLLINAIIPGIDRERFKKCAEKAKDECPVSKVLNLNISLEATVNNEIIYNVASVKI